GLGAAPRPLRRRGARRSGARARNRPGPARVRRRRPLEPRPHGSRGRAADRRAGLRAGGDGRGPGVGRGWRPLRRRAAGALARARPRPPAGRPRQGEPRPDAVRPEREVSAVAPQDSVIAVVGDGFGSLIVYSTAVYLGFAPEQLAVYGESEH